VLFGNGQHLEIHPWQAVEQMTVRLDKVAWEINTWYPHEAARGESSGRHHARAGQVWPRDKAEPAKWMIEKV
jgi:hypothetical protein